MYVDVLSPKVMEATVSVFAVHPSKLAGARPHGATEADNNHVHPKKNTQKTINQKQVSNL